MLNVQIIKSYLTDEIIVDIMKSLGSKDPICIRDGYYFSTICHNIDDGKYKLHYHTDTQRFYCYTNCGHIGDIFNVICNVLKCDFNTALQYVLNFIPNINTNKFVYKIDNSFINKFNYNRPIEHTEYDDKILNIYEKNIYHKSWIDDYISIDIMKKYNICFDIANYQIIIPIYDENNKLRGIKSRKLLEKDIKNGKYGAAVIDDVVYKYKSSSLLYGVNWNKENIKKYKTVIIGESEKFVMQYSSFYCDSIAVALSGSYISDEQIKILLRYGVSKVILALDKDFNNIVEQQEYIIKIQKNIIVKLIPYFNISIIWDTHNLLDYKMSPTDKGKTIFEKLFNERIFI